MKTVLRRALVATLLLSAGCSLTIDPNSVEAPKATPKVTPRGACVDSSSHKLCGGDISAGALALNPSAAHAIADAHVGSAGAPQGQVAGPQHKIVRGDVSP